MGATSGVNGRPWSPGSCATAGSATSARTLTPAGAKLYRNLIGVTGRDPARSVHLAAMPVQDPALIDPALEERMERAERIVMLVRAMRMKSNLKVRQPLRRIILPIAGEHEREAVRAMEDVIRDEINVKRIEYVTDESGLVLKKARPNFKALGPKFGKSVQPVAARIRELTPAEIAALERDGRLEVEAGGASRTIGREDVDIVREDVQGWLVESDGALTVALDTTLDDALVAEGVAREFVNRVQNMRKDAGFAVTDRIALYVDAPAPVGSMLEAMRGYIQAETLAVEFSPAFREGEYASAVELDGVTVRAGIERRPQG